jgi:3D (Asp-Asp-Asp) domain-containing protein
MYKITGFILAFTVGFLGMELYREKHKEPPQVRVVSPETIQMEVTAYCPCEKCCGRWADGFFADGSPVGGRAVAADTSIYPFGTTFDVPGYGVAVVKDRGGAIKGKNRLDLYFSTHQEALNWGRQTIEVTKER